MLVLTRKQSEEVVFPSLGIAVRVLRLGGNSVRLGIDAPRHLRVMRGELAEFADLYDKLAESTPAAISHAVRNRLNSIGLKLQLLQKLEKQRSPEASLELIENIVNELSALDSDLGHEVVPQNLPEQSKAGLRLLVVDDDINECSLLAAALTLQGFLVDRVGDGADALRFLREQSRLPDAVLLDMNMPKLCGEKTLQQIRLDGRLKSLRVLGISGSIPRQEFLSPDLPGFDGWFSKPIQLDALIGAIQIPTQSSASIHKAR